MSKTNTINILIINSATLRIVEWSKCIHGPVLVSNYFTTDLAVGDSIYGESNSSTSRSAASPTHSFWTSESYEMRRTVVLRVSHVQFNNAHPT